jgi:hypothetical protein
MRHSLARVAIILLLTAGCVGSEGPNGSESTSATDTASAPPDSSKIVVRPGRVGEAAVGLSKVEAIATGLFDADVDGVKEGCKDQLRWKSQYTGLDVRYDEKGTITSIGVTEGGPKTSAHVGVGSTLAQVQTAYPDLSPVAEMGFEQAGAIRKVGDKYIGFLFGDDKLETVNPESKVTFMEVTSGSKPKLQRGGCECE